MRQEGINVFSSIARRNGPNNAAASSSAAGPSSGKRPATSSSFNSATSPLKRSRLDNSTQGEEGEDDDDVVIISDSRDQNLHGGGRGRTFPTKKFDSKKKYEDKQQMPTREVLQFFRLDPKKLEYVSLRWAVT